MDILQTKVESQGYFSRLYMHSTNDASADNDEFLLSNIKKSSDKLDETKINRFQHSQTAKNLLKALQKGQEA